MKHGSFTVMKLSEGKSCPTCGVKYKGAYMVWIGIKSRCNNPNAPGYANYGGRGIKICDRWINSYETFIEDVGERPSPQHTLDRIDNDGDYEPSNCRWATYKEQHRNTRRNVYVTWNGETKTVADWADQMGLSRQSLYRRLKRWSLEDAMTRPSQQLLFDQRRDAGEQY